MHTTLDSWRRFFKNATAVTVLTACILLIPSLIFSTWPEQMRLVFLLPALAYLGDGIVQTIDGAKFSAAIGIALAILLTLIAFNLV